MTSTAAEWVLAEGHAADGTVLDHGSLGLRCGTGMRVVDNAEQVAAEVLRARATVTAGPDHLRVIGVTWSHDATAEAALLLESLTSAGLDNVVPVRLLEALEALAGTTALVIGFQRTAVCVLEDDWATVVMVDTADGATHTVSKHVRGSLDGLIRWLSETFDRNGWHPDAVVVIGSDSETEAISSQLEETLPVPVFMQTNAPLAVARGAALAAAQSIEFTDARLLDTPGKHRAAPVPSRRLSHAGALTGLVAGTVTLVASLSLAVGLRLAPERDSGTAEKAVPPPAPYVAAAQTPALPPPTEVAAPVVKASQQPSPPAPEVAPKPAPAVQEALSEPAASEEQAPAPPVAPAPQEEQTSAPAAPSPEPGDQPPLLTRLLEQLQGLGPH